MPPLSRLKDGRFYLAVSRSRAFTGFICSIELCARAHATSHRFASDKAAPICEGSRPLGTTIAWRSCGSIRFGSVPRFVLHRFQTTGDVQEDFAGKDYYTEGKNLTKIIVIIYSNYILFIFNYYYLLQLYFCSNFL